ncbi:MAG TPA: GYD domain-containing protein [candidate division Zixibacteria bacterium]|nr:GYD domain-containing protein [candidate division Zixibacteria bacterium]MDD4916684.1 GYD domain-containing protein [candidate division Zixibacteria bacterium]MDM7973329.1 GYD domain-containing protein [candidate division Zixibacteria bacterium]HOD67226.1 GYD domain-containing protein [candidate division Zixibacteria bacterium]HOZ07990.1 GYD domain-containing protein [candidate division Zixibacteria bacterium]
MKTYVVVSKISQHGPSLVEVAAKMQSLDASGRQWIQDVQQHCPEVRFLAHYALLGPYDFLDIYEAPDEESAAKVSLLASADRMFTVESWTAIPDKRLAEVLRALRRRRTDGDPKTA